MPLLVLEGPDGSGKSTLAQKLLKGTGHPTLLIKRSGSPGAAETLRFQNNWIHEQGQSPLNIIADRHPIISEAVYDRVVRDRGSVYTLPDAIEALTKPGIMVVYCRAETGKMFENAHVEEQMDGVFQNYRNLVNEYDYWMQSLEEQGINIYWHNYISDPSMTDAIEEVKRFWEGKR